MGLNVLLIISALILAVGIVILMLTSVVYTAIYLAEDLAKEIYEWIRKR